MEIIVAEEDPHHAMKGVQCDGRGGKEIANIFKLLVKLKD